MRAAQGVTSQYVKQQTGVSLTTWTDLVASSSAQFEAYLSQLETVAALSQRYHTAAASQLDPDEAREDQKILRETRWRTQAWKQVLGRVAQLGRLVDTILKMNLTGEPGLPDADRSDRSSSLSGSLQKRIKDVQSRTVEKSSDLREWVLQPFVEIRDSVKRLPSQTERLAQEVALLEVLLELEVAEIRACLGEIPPTEVRVVGLRVAAGVTLPELGRRLATARQRALAHQTYLDRLDWRPQRRRRRRSGLRHPVGGIPEQPGHQPVRPGRTRGRSRRMAARRSSGPRRLRRLDDVGTGCPGRAGSDRAAGGGR